MSSILKLDGEANMSPSVHSDNINRPSPKMRLEKKKSTVKKKNPVSPPPDLVALKLYEQVADLSFTALGRSHTPRKRFLVTTQQDKALALGYSYVRDIAAIYSEKHTYSNGEEEPKVDCVPLIQTYNRNTRDFAVQVGDSKWVDGYTQEWLEGWVCRRTSSNLVGPIPLFSYINPETGDIVAVEGSKRSVQWMEENLEGYTLLRKECHVLRASRAKSNVQQIKMLYNFDSMLPQELARIEKSAIIVQRVFRGHSARLRFKSLKTSVLESVVANVCLQRAQSSIVNLQAMLMSLSEAFSTLNLRPEDKQEAFAYGESLFSIYNNLFTKARARENEKQQRLRATRELISSSDSGRQHRLRANSVRIATQNGIQTFQKRVQMLNIWIRKTLGLGSNSLFDESLDSQQDTWSTMPIFRVMLEDDLQKVKSLVSGNVLLLKSRDQFGATPFLISLLLERKRICRWLLQHFPHVAFDNYNSPAFKGEAPIHFSIVKRDLEMCKLILEANPQAIYSRAVGDFFKDNTTPGVSYFGELPLFFAISTNQPDIVSHLLSFGRNRLGLSESQHLQMRDGDANTVYHMCVYHNLPEMYTFIEKLCEKYGAYQSDFPLYNKFGKSPFSLSAELGKQEIFSRMLEANTDVKWSFGASSYRVVYIDEIEPSSRRQTRHKSILQILVDNEHQDLLNLPLIRNFTEKKWSNYVREVFLRRLAFVAVYLAFFIIVCMKTYHRADSESNCSLFDPNFTMTEASTFRISFHPFTIGSTIFRYISCVVTSGYTVERSTAWTIPYPLHLISEFFVFFGVFYKGYKEFVEMSESGIKGYFGVRGSMLFENILSTAFCTLTAFAYILRIIGSSYENTVLAGSALILWTYVLWLMLGFAETGPFIIMIWKMLTKDIRQFVFIFVVFQFGFAQCFHLLLFESVKGEGSEVGFFLSQVKASFEVLLGENPLGDMYEVGIVAYLSMMIYVILVSILLVNLLIAMMSTTYSEIFDESDAVWNLEWTRLILSLESELSESERDRNKWYQLIEGRRCFTLPMSSEDSVKEYMNHQPDWDQVNKLYFSDVPEETSTPRLKKKNTSCRLLDFSFSEIAIP